MLSLEDDLVIAGKRFKSRLLIGSAHFPDPKTRKEAIEASFAEIVTVAIRRQGVHLKHDLEGYFLLPNTAGCYTAAEAVLYARLAQEALKTNWIKLEVIGDDRTLLPDVVELLNAAKTLIAEGFIVLPYCTDDPITCRKLEDMGCAAVMPLGAPIGTGRGILNPYNLEMLRREISIPIIVDAGLGKPSDASIALELGADGVLVNTAIAEAIDPVAMAKGFRLCVEGGRFGYKAGKMVQKAPTSSSPREGKIRCSAPY